MHPFLPDFDSWGELCVEDIVVVSIVLVTSLSLILRSSSTKSMTVARLSCDLKKYSCKLIVVVIMYVNHSFVFPLQVY